VIDDRRRRAADRGSLVTLVFAVTVWAALPSLAQSPNVRPIPSPVASPTRTAVPPGAIVVEVSLTAAKNRLQGDDSVAWVPALGATGNSASRVKIAQNKKQFEPRITVVSVGSTVDFPNFDRVFHNVFSLSQPQPFDLGLYRRGKSESVLFQQPGLIQIFCNIHPQMVAYLMVVDSRRHGAADTQGRITLRDIPPGLTVVEGWNVRGGMWSREVEVRPGRTTTLDVDLDVSSWRDVPHLNKYGKEYPPPDDDEFRY
jgi:plastocyanin